MNIDDRLDRMASGFACLYRDVDFSLNGENINPLAVFNSAGALPLLVAGAMKTLNLVHRNSEVRDLFPFAIIPATQRSMLGVEVVVRPDTSFGMGCLFAMDAVQEAMKFTLSPGMVALDVYVEELDAIIGALKQQVGYRDPEPEEMIQPAAEDT